jgi:hypothetical protein
LHGTLTSHFLIDRKNDLSEANRKVVSDNQKLIHTGTNVSQDTQILWLEDPVPSVEKLKPLRLLDKQQALRSSLAERLIHGTMLPLNYLDFHRVHKPTIHDTRMTEQLERRQ